MNILQKIFNDHYEELLYILHPRKSVIENVEKMLNCGDPSFGGAMYGCPHCGELKFVPFRCHSKFCPTCGVKYCSDRSTKMSFKLVRCTHRHCVFTIDEVLRPFFLKDRNLLNCLFQAVRSVILTMFHKMNKSKNFIPGFVCVLHTFGRPLEWNPHIHLVVLGGGLDKDGYWKTKGDKFFLPVKVISKVFRGKYLSGVKALYKEKKLLFHGTCEKCKNHYQFQSLLDDCYAKEWVPYCKKTFQNAYSVIEYLGRYTHRIAISNHRIVSMNQESVTYRVKDYRNNGIWTTMTVSGVEFIRRFLMHILPKRYVRIRSYGLLCNRSKRNNLIRCRNLIGCKKYVSSLKNMKTDDILKHLFGVDVHICPDCGSEKYGNTKVIQQKSPLKKGT